MIKVKLHDFGDGKRGVIATEDIEANELLMFVPDSFLLKSQFSPEEESPLENHLDDLSTFAVFLME